MKKLFAVLFTLALVLSLAACSQDAAGETTVIATALPAETTAVTVPYQDGVYTVSTVDEFIAAIGPDREIRLEEGTYDLSTASTYAGETGNAWCFWDEM